MQVEILHNTRTRKQGLTEKLFPVSDLRDIPKRRGGNRETESENLEDRPALTRQTHPLRLKHGPDTVLRLQPELLCAEDFLHGPMLALIARLKKHASLSLACASVIFLHHVVGEQFLNDRGSASGCAVLCTNRRSWTPSGLASSSERAAALSPGAEY